MASVPKRISEGIVSGIKKYQPILSSAKARDVGEADTVTIIKDMLSEVFGYDKYSEITSEFSIRGTYCDLAIKLDNKLATLIEAKAIGLDLKEQHVKQAVDYAANQGVDWVLLTNCFARKDGKNLRSASIIHTSKPFLDFLSAQFYKQIQY